MLSLGPGAYRVEVQMTGFVKAQREAVNVGVSETVRLDFALEGWGPASTEKRRHETKKTTDRKT